MGRIWKLQGFTLNRSMVGMIGGLQRVESLEK